MKRWPSYRDLKKWLTLAVALLGLLYGTIFLFPIVPNQSNAVDGSSYRVKINPNSGLTSIADQLNEQGLAVNSVALHLGARSLLVASKLKPGTYLLPYGESLGKVLLQIA